jgi:hypothetical protein
MSINYERKNSSTAVNNNMLIKFLSLLPRCLWLFGIYIISALTLGSCSTKIVDKLKTLQQPSNIEGNGIVAEELSISKEMEYPLESITPDSISDTTFAFLFIIFSCLIFTFPGLISYYFSYVKGIFQRKD